MNKSLDYSLVQFSLQTVKLDIYNSLVFFGYKTNQLGAISLEEFIKNRV